jgi:hypothetical protein
MASIAVVAPAGDSRVSGTVQVRVRVTGGQQVRSVAVIIGAPQSGTLPASSAGGDDHVVRWDTTRLVADPTTKAPADALYWLSATAVVDGTEITAPLVPVITANHPAPASVSSTAGGWRPELEWAADYSGSTAQWAASHSAVIGGAYATVHDDPILGAARRAVLVSVPDSAGGDPDQPTPTTVRFQTSSVQNIVEGDEFCVGFAYLPPDDFPSVYPLDDVTNPRDEATGYIAIFQFYGPPYLDGAPFILHARRRTVDDPVDEFNVRGDELNPGDPGDFLALPYRRGQWTDIVFRIRASSSIESGWVETYVNQGESTGVRPLATVNGLVRVPRVLLRPESGAFRTDMQIYRVRGRLQRVAMWHTGHRIAETVAEADPRSYRDGGQS